MTVGQVFKDVVRDVEDVALASAPIVSAFDPALAPIISAATHLIIALNVTGVPQPEIAAQASMGQALDLMAHGYTLGTGQVPDMTRVRSIVAAHISDANTYFSRLPGVQEALQEAFPRVVK